MALVRYIAQRDRHDPWGDEIDGLGFVKAGLSIPRMFGSGVLAPTLGAGRRLTWRSYPRGLEAIEDRSADG